MPPEELDAMWPKRFQQDRYAAESIKPKTATYVLFVATQNMVVFRITTSHVETNFKTTASFAPCLNAHH